MIIHIKMNRQVEMVVTTVKAAMMLGMMKSRPEPISRQKQENSNAEAGTAWRDKRANRLGATPAVARPKSMRLVE